MRQIVLDTETTGLESQEGHRILELGCVEVVDRRLTRTHLHHYINPERDIDEGALEVHGITLDFLKDKPRFHEIWPEFLEFVRGAELIIHNAPFDVAFINAEMRRIDPGLGDITDYCEVTDSLAIARNKHPGQKNSLDALCKRYSVDNTQRTLHGALLDAEILADVFLLMTGGQVTLGLDDFETKSATGSSTIRRLSADRPPLKVVRASDQELADHVTKLETLDRIADEGCLWSQLETAK